MRHRYHPSRYGMHGPEESAVQAISQNMDKSQPADMFTRAAKAPIRWNCYLAPTGYTGAFRVNVADINSQTLPTVAQEAYDYPSYFDKTGKAMNGTKVIMQQLYIDWSDYINNLMLQEFMAQKATLEIKVDGARYQYIAFRDIPVLNRKEFNIKYGPAATPEDTETYTGTSQAKPIELYVNNNIKGVTLSPLQQLELWITFPAGWSGTVFGSTTAANCWFGLVAPSVILFAV